MGLFLHIKLPSAAVLEILDYGVEAAAAGSLGDGDGIYIQLHRYHSALVALAHLLGYVEDEGAIHTVIELHGYVQVVTVNVGHLIGTCNTVSGLVTESEAEQSATYYIYAFGRGIGSGGWVIGGSGVVGYQGKILLHTGVEVDGDSVLACDTCVQGGGTCHTREVGVAVH